MRRDPAKHDPPDARRLWPAVRLRGTPVKRTELPRLGRAAARRRPGLARAREHLRASGRCTKITHLVSVAGLRGVVRTDSGDESAIGKEVSFSIPKGAVLALIGES